MSVDQENVTRILSVLSHPLRRQILQRLSEREECSFTDLMNALNVDTGKLSFHIKNLQPFLEQTSSGKYKLSRVGENAIVFIKDLEAWSVEAEIAKRTSSFPLASFGKRAIAFLIDFGIAFALFMAIPNALSSITQGEGLLRSFFSVVNLVLFPLLLWIYLTLLEGFAGQTLGKRTIGLKVVTIDGKKVSYDRAAVRNFGTAFAFLFPFDLFIGVWLKDKRYMRYFEKFSGTTVTDIRKESPRLEKKNVQEEAKPEDSGDRQESL
jgi:uncharacterized RDD family membrane protein YckC